MLRAVCCSVQYSVRCHDQSRIAIMLQFCTPAFIHKVGDCGGSDTVVGVNLGEFRFFTDVFQYPVKFVATNWSQVEPNFIVIIPLRILSRILKESIALMIEFDDVKLQSFVSIVLSRCFVHSCEFLTTAWYIIHSSRMFFLLLHHVPL